MEHKSDIIHLANPDDICLKIKKELSRDSDPFMNNFGKETINFSWNFYWLTSNFTNDGLVS